MKFWTGLGLSVSHVKYVGSHPDAFFDAEVFHVWTFGVASYTDEKFKQNFRHNSFFIGNNTRSAVNKGLADCHPLSTPCNAKHHLWVLDKRRETRPA